MPDPTVSRPETSRDHGSAPVLGAAPDLSSLPPSPGADAGRPRPLLRVMGYAKTLAPGMSERVQRLLIRAGYRVVNRSLQGMGRTCLNYGWAELDDAPQPAGTESDPDRYGLQLYARVASGTDLTGKDVLEVGSGRGGGTSSLRTALGAGSVIGVDLTASSVRWCREHWHTDGLRFDVGDAEQLPLADNCVDVVVNVESSHNYPHVDRFLAEAFRVVRPGGHLLLADLRPTPEMPVLRQQILDAGFRIEEEEDITANVLHALTLDTASRQRWVEQRFWKPLRPAVYEFAGATGTGVFEAMRAGEWTYHRFVATA